MPVHNQLSIVNRGVLAIAFVDHSSPQYNIRNCNLQNGCNANSPEAMFNTKQI